MARKVLSEAEADHFLARVATSGLCDLKGFDLSHDETMLFLCDAIASRKGLTIAQVDISGSTISVSGLELLISALVPLQSLETFSARSCLLTKEAGLAISKLLSSSGVLKTLDLRDNMLGDPGVTALFAPFNETFSGTGAASLSLFSVQAIDLSQNVITDAGVLAVCRALMQFTRRSQALGVANHLERLYFNSNRLGEKAAYCLAQLLNSKPYPGSVGPGKSPYFPCGVKELHVNHNAIGANGIMSLLGDLKQQSFSPLRVLSAAHCITSFRVLDHLAALVAHDSLHVELLDLSFSDNQAKECVYLSAKHYDSIYGSGVDAEKHHAASLHLSAKRLADALLRVSHAHRVRLRHLLLGALPKTVFALCIQGSYERNHSLFEDCLKALEFLNPAAEFLCVPYIANLQAWLKSEQYENPALAVAPPAAPPVPKIASSAAGGPIDRASPVPVSAPAARPSATNPINPPNGASAATPPLLEHSMTRRLLNDSRGGQSLLDMSASVATPSLLRPGAVAPSTAASPSPRRGRPGARATSATTAQAATPTARRAQADKVVRHAAQATAKLFADEDDASMLSALEGSTVNHIHGITGAEDLPEEASLLELKEQEYLRRRHNHTSALHTLSGEIQELIKASPDKSLLQRTRQSAQLEKEPTETETPAEEFSQLYSSEVREALRQLQQQRLALRAHPSAETSDGVGGDGPSASAPVTAQHLQAAISGAVAQVLAQVPLQVQPQPALPPSPMAVRSAQLLAETSLFSAYPAASPPPAPVPAPAPAAPPAAPPAASADLAVLQNTLLTFMNKMSSDVQTLISQQLSYERAVSSAVGSLEQRLTALEAGASRASPARRALPASPSSYGYGARPVGGAEVLLLGDLVERLDMIEKYMVLEKRHQQLANQQLLLTAGSTSTSPSRDVPSVPPAPPAPPASWPVQETPAVSTAAHQTPFAPSASLGSTWSTAGPAPVPVPVPVPEDRRSLRRRILDQMMQTEDAPFTPGNADNDNESVQSLASLPRYRSAGSSNRPMHAASMDRDVDLEFRGSGSDSGGPPHRRNPNNVRREPSQEDLPPFPAGSASRRPSLRRDDPKPARPVPGYLGPTGQAMRRHSSYM